MCVQEKVVQINYDVSLVLKYNHGKVNFVNSFMLTALYKAYFGEKFPYFI